MADWKHGSLRTRCLRGLIVAFLALSPLTGALGRTVTIRLGDQHRVATDFVMKQYGVSEAAAQRIVHQFELKNGKRILDSVELPEGAQLDFWTVRNSADPKRRAEFRGSGTLVDAWSYLGRNMQNTLFGLLNTEDRDNAIQLLRQARDYGFMVVPAALKTRRPAVVTPRAAQTYRIGVVMAEFPQWVDPRPVGTGAPGGQTGTFYQAGLPANPPTVYPAGSDTTAWEQYAGEFYMDSVGGIINTNGIPLGLQSNAAAYTTEGVNATTTGANEHPRFGGDAIAGSIFPEPPVQMRQRLYDLVFNKTLDSSLYSWFYQNSHGHVSVEGATTSVVGWVDDHHILDRMPWPQSNYYCVQPGTPLLRPQSPASNGIVRASLWQNGSTYGLTLFFRKDVSINIGDITLTAFQSQDLNSQVAGTQVGEVPIHINDPAWAATSTLHMDPWDSRRWTLTAGAWKVDDQGYPGDPTHAITFVPSPGGHYTVQVANHAPDLGVSPAIFSSPGTGGQGDECNGCADLPGTLFTQADVVDAATAAGATNASGHVGPAAGNRLLSFCYYGHNGAVGNAAFATFSSGASAYQLWHVDTPTGYHDDIAGSVENAGDRQPRPFPFDHDISDHAHPNLGGFFGSSSGNHTDSKCWSDVTMVMQDQGITYGNYDQLFFMYPSDLSQVAAGEVGGSPPSAASSAYAGFIPHSGNPIPLPSDAGVTLMAHEICHNFGAEDLYDTDFYVNNATPPPSPKYFEALMVTPYSVMGHGGFRLDPYHELKIGWVPGVPVLQDLGYTTISQVEQTLREPQILKLPANPLCIYAAKNPTAPASFTGFPWGTNSGGATWASLADPTQWQEYYLVENRHVTSGPYLGDQSPHGLYIWHVDTRTTQRPEAWHKVAVVQADGRNDLETLADGTVQSQAMIDGDPYPGATGNRTFNERIHTVPDVVQGGTRNAPTSWSYGVPDVGAGVNGHRALLAGSASDSFVRITNITGPEAGPEGMANAAGDPMSAYVYVEPAEVIVTGTPMSTLVTTVTQGTKDFPVMEVTLDNNGTFPNLSTNPVTINSLHVFEVGTSLRDANIAQAKLYDDISNSGTIAGSPLIKTALVVNDYIDFTNLGYTVPLGQKKHLIIAYDIATDAQVVPAVTLGAEFTRFDYINPTAPGAVQQRARLAVGGAGTQVAGGDGYTFGDYRFPITSNTFKIIKSPTTLTVVPKNLVPAPIPPAPYATVVQGAQNVAMIQLGLSVDHDQSTITSLAVKNIGTALGGTDIATVTAYDDSNGDGKLEANEIAAPLGSAAFVSGVATINGLNYIVKSTATRYIILGVNVQPAATQGNLIQLQIPDNTYVGLALYPLPNPQDLVALSPPSAFSTTSDEIVGADRAPYPPASGVGTPSGHNYLTDWAPVTGSKTPNTQPSLTFPRARLLNPDPPGIPDPDINDTAGTISYQVQFSQDQFTTILYSQTIPPNPAGPPLITFTVGQPLAQGTWYWRVRAVDSSGLTSDWAPASPATMTLQIVTAPTPPTNLTTSPAPVAGQVQTLTPQFVWTLGTSGGTPANQLTTRLQIDSNYDFHAPLWTLDIANGATTYQTDAAHKLTLGTHYYMRAATVDPTDGLVSAWSAPSFEFTVVSNKGPLPPTTGFLANGQPCGPKLVISTNVPTLQWDAPVDPNNAPADMRYYVQLNNDNDFIHGHTIIPHTPTAFGVTQWVITTALAENKECFWRVMTENRLGMRSGWSAVQTFWVNVRNDPPGQPVSGFSPAGYVRLETNVATLSVNAVTDPDPFQVDPVNGPFLTYEFQLRANNSNWGPDPGTYDYRFLVAGTTNPVTVTTGALPGNVWLWRVRAIDPLGLAGSWSLSQSFRVNRPPNPPPSPNPAWTPDHKIVSSLPTLSFPRGSDADFADGDVTATLSYIVLLSPDQGATWRAINIPANPADPAVITFTVGAPALASGPWWWRVETVDDGGAVSPQSATHFLAVDNPPNPPTAPFSPSGVIVTTRQPIFSWTIGTDPDVSDPPTTLRTVLEVSDSPAFITPLVVSATTAPGASSLVCPVSLQPGVTYFWHARTMDSSGLQSANCPDQSFTVENSKAPSAPDVGTMAPSGGVIVASYHPTITWGAAFSPDNLPSQLHYIVQLDTSGDWTDGVDLLGGKGVTAPGVTKLPITAITLAEDTQYYYRIRTVDSDGLQSDWSYPTQTFWVNVVNEPPNKPSTGFSPNNGVTVNTQRPTLQCDQAFDPDPNDRPSWTLAPAWPANAMTYVFQLRPGNNNWAAGYNFQYTVKGNVNPTFVQATVLDLLSDKTTWYWRVMAVDQHGAQSAWSDTQYFVISTGTAAPTLSAPSGDYTQAVVPKYGGLTTAYEFQVIYTDPTGNPPKGGIMVQVDNSASKQWAMSQLDSTQSFTTGAEFVAGISGGDVGYGGHTFRFVTAAGAIVWPTAADPALAGKGPIVTSPATIRFTNNSLPAVTTTTFEKGSDIWIELTAPDQNVKPGVAETVTVTVYAGNTPAGATDSANVVLTETGPNTGVFRGRTQLIDGTPSPPEKDGKLRATVGAAGQPISVTYNDPLDGADCPPALVVSATAAATVVDTTAPTPAQPYLTAASGPQGISVLLDWSKYAPFAPADVVTYRIYLKTSPFASTAGLAPIMTVPAGTYTATIPNLVPNTNYWVAVVPIDSVPNATPVAGNEVTTADTQGPQLLNAVPTAGQTAVALNTHVAFDLNDPGTGVNDTPPTFHLYINGTDMAASPLLVRSGTATTRHFDLTPPGTGWAWNETVTVRVVCYDVAGNKSDTTWKFYTVTDTVAPTITGITPDPTAAAAAVTTPLSFHIQDDLSGVNTSTLVIKANTGKGLTNITSACTVDSTNPLDVVVTYTPPTGWPWGATVQIAVSVADNAGNHVVPYPYTWSFTVQADTTPPTIGDLVPAPNATNVPLDTTIGFQLADTQSGIDRTKVAVYINGSPTPVPSSTLAFSGSNNALNVVYTPATAPPYYTYGQIVTVRVVAYDFSGNLLLDANGNKTNGYTWSFTCRSAPRYRIMGTVTDSTGAALAGATVTAYPTASLTPGTQVGSGVSDGTGSYIVLRPDGTGLLAGTYWLQATLTGYSFTPSPSLKATLVDRDLGGQNFVGTQLTYSISGTVTENTTGTPVGKPGVTITVTNAAGVALPPVTTAADGTYTVPSVPGGRYTVTPSLTYYDFRPTALTVIIAGAPATGQNFQAVAQTFTVSGTVRDYNGNRLQGVSVTDGTHSAVTDEAGTYTLSGIRGSSTPLTLTATKAGYMIALASSAPVVVPPSATGVDFIANLSFTNSFPSGRNFVGVPCYPVNADPTVVFGTSLVTRWDPSASPPAYITPSSGTDQEILQVIPGRGFFVTLPGGQLQVAGRPVSVAAPFTLTLGSLWNMAANPFQGTLPFANLVPSVAGSLVPYGYVLDNASGSYLLISATPGVNVARTSIFPWEGVWLRTNGVPASVSVTPPPAGAAEVKAVAPRAVNLGAGGWFLPVSAKVGDRRDTTTAVGVGPALAQAIQLDSPPMAANTVKVFILSADGRYLAQDIRAGSAAGGTWQLAVVTDVPKATVELNLGDLTRVPQNLNVYLTDLTTGRRMYARTLTSYTFVSGDTGGTRKFKLEVVPRTDAGLTVTGAAATRTGAGMVVTYSVTKACQVSVKITNLAGRVVRTICDGLAAGTGVNTLAWDMRNQSGAAVPSGRYLIQIVGIADDGQKVQTVAPVVVQR